MRYWRRCGSFLSVFPPYQSQGHSVYIRIQQTARHQPQSLAQHHLQPVSLPGVAGCERCWTASSRELRAVMSWRKGWGRKTGGGWYFQLSWKTRTCCVGLGGVIQDQPANFLFLVKLGVENPPTHARFPHQAPRHSPSTVILHGKICNYSLLAVLSDFFWREGKLF